MTVDPFDPAALQPVGPGTGDALVLTGAQVLGHPGADAIAIGEGRILWWGPSSRAETLGLPMVRIGAGEKENLVLAPAFVDAHAHVLHSGRGLAGLDLTHTGSVAELLGTLATAARAEPGVLLHGQGWDHTGWPEGRPPMMAEIDRAADGAPVYLSRVEMHSALVSSALVTRVPGLAEADGFDPSGWVTRDAFALASRAVAALFTDSQKTDQVRLALQHATRCGLGSVQEMSAPHINTAEELQLTRRVAAEVGIGLPAFWGEEADPDLLDWATTEGLRGLGGDLNCDGAIGSRTACVSGGYHDHGSEGFLYLDLEAATRHVVACTRAGLQAGFHCIGDRGVSTAARAIARAGEICGAETVRRIGHRLEHAEMTTPETMQVMADSGAIASMQPVFDAWWGGPGGLYDQRLGSDRPAMNRFASLHRAGVRLAFGSDSPVTPFSGWEVVRAAVNHWHPEERLSIADAFAATTLGGHRSVCEQHRGMIEVGAAADLAVWSVPELIDGWPDLSAYAVMPHCVLTLVNGRPVFDERETLSGRGSAVPTGNRG